MGTRMVMGVFTSVLEEENKTKTPPKQGFTLVKP